MLSIACLYWNHKHTIALFARVEGTSLSTAHGTSKAPHFGQPKISRSPPPQHAPPPPQPQAHGDTTYLALEEVLVLHLQLRQRFRHGCKQAEEPKNGVWSSWSNGIPSLPGNQKFSTGRTCTLRTRQNRHKMCSRKDERRASCRRRADPRGEGADHPARS